MQVLKLKILRSLSNDGPCKGPTLDKRLGGKPTYDHLRKIMVELHTAQLVAHTTDEGYALTALGRQVVESRGASPAKTR